STLVPPFEPHPWLRGAHAQTIAGRYWGVTRKPLRATTHLIDLEDGDRLAVLVSVPPGWSSARPTAMLVHGLAGSSEASYVVRVAFRLVQLGVRVVRVNLRGAGVGFGLARGIYHAGCSEDLRAVVAWLEGRSDASPLAAIGFSLGANLVLKLAVE